MSKPPVLAIVGFSGSGKTTLIERLLPELKRRALRVGTIKHAHHALALDTPGKDSWRHRHAGAEGTLLVGPDSIQLVADAPSDASPEQMAGQFFPSLDLVLVEGFSSMPGPKIEIVRRGRSERLCADDSLLAIATDDPTFNCMVPVLDLNHAEAIGDFIVHWMADSVAD